MSETPEGPSPDMVNGKPVMHEKFPGSDQMAPPLENYDAFEPQPAVVSPEEQERRQRIARIAELQAVLSELLSPEPTIISPRTKEYRDNGGTARAALDEMSALLSVWEEDPKLELARAERDKFFAALANRDRAAMRAADQSYEKALGDKVTGGE